MLDTNVVLSALLFQGGVVPRVRDAWRRGAFAPLASAETVSELIQTLAYPKFRLMPDQRHDLLADYLPYTTPVRIPDPAPPVPACRDPSDLQFLTLAIAGRADMLVSGDRDLLALSGRFPVRICGVSDLLNAIAD